MQIAIHGDNMLLYFFIIVLSVILFYFSIKIENSRINSKRKRFRNRLGIPINKIYDIYYIGSGIDRGDFVFIWANLGRFLKLDPCKILPTDRFDREFAAAKWELNVDEMEDVWDFFREEITKRNLQLIPIEDVETVDRFVRILCKRQ